MRRPVVISWLIFAACRSGPGTGSIDGAVSLTLPNGDIAPAIGGTVRVIPRADSLDAALDRLCLDYTARFRAIAAGLPDSVPIDSLLPTRASLAMLRPRRLERAVRRWGASAPRTRALRSGFDSLRTLQDHTEALVHTVLVPATARRTSVDAEGRFRFDTLVPGRYAIWAEARIGDNDYTWWAETTIAAGDALSLALGRSRLAGAQRYCHIR